MIEHKTHWAKRYAFRAGHYMCPTPPVCHFNWSEDAWCDWIDSQGVWT